MSVLTQIIIGLFLIIPIAAIILIITRDAGKKGLSGMATLGWVLVSLCLFPIGLLLYFLITHQNRGR
jgi:hypothetical protein